MRTMISPPRKNAPKPMKPEALSCTMPESPNPLGHPAAMRTPNIAMNPPMNPQIARVAMLDPKRARHLSGIACHLNSLNSQAASA